MCQLFARQFPPNYHKTSWIVQSSWDNLNLMKFDICGSASCCAGWKAPSSRNSRVPDFNHCIKTWLFLTYLRLMKLVHTFNLFNERRSFNLESFGTKQLGLCMIVSGRAKILNFSLFVAGLGDSILVRGSILIIFIFIFYFWKKLMRNCFKFAYWDIFFTKNVRFPGKLDYFFYIFLYSSQLWIQKNSLKHHCCADKMLEYHVSYVSSTMK